MTTKTLDYQTIVDALYDAGMDEDNLYHNYSGRGMYGDTCFGITYSNLGDLLHCVAQMAHKDVDLNFLGRASSDSMGLDSIVYFPGWTLDGAPEDD